MLPMMMKMMMRTADMGERGKDTALGNIMTTEKKMTKAHIQTDSGS